MSKPDYADVSPRHIMSITEAIYARRTVRNFTPETIPQTSIHALLYAAVQAPNAMNEEPWAFAVIQDRSELKELSDFSGRLFNAHEEQGLTPSARSQLEHSGAADFNIFHNAGTLIIIYGRSNMAFAEADCWLAAQNIMLAAVGMGLASCVVGLALSALNTPEWKMRLEVPEGLTAIAPVLIGWPALRGDVVMRKPPEILSWTT